MITVVCILSISAFISIYLSNERQRLNNEIDVLLDTHSKALAKPLWGLDRDAVEKLLQVMSGHDHIAYVGVWTDGNNASKLFAERGVQVPGDNALTAERDIIEPDNGEMIGRLKLAVSGDHVQFAVKAIWWVGFAIVSAIIGISVGVIYLSFHVFTRPLRALTRTMQRLSDGDIDVDIPSLDRSDEIGDIARSIERFKANAIKIRAMTGEFRNHAKRLEDSLGREKEFNALQRQFISMVSHEFRTPLAIIDSAAGRLKKGAQTIGSEASTPWLDRIQTSVVRIIQLIEGAVSASHLDEGKIVAKPQACDIAALVKDAQESLTAARQTHRCDVHLDGMPSQFFGDPKLLRQVFSNLISNALKYSPEGSTITIEGRSDGVNMTVSIRDQGMGIPRGEMDRLFNRFFRGKKTTGIPGTGNGLYVTKAFVDMHDGVLSVESTENDGACFTVQLPVGGKAGRVSADEETDLLEDIIGIDERLFAGT